MKGSLEATDDRWRHPRGPIVAHAQGIDQPEQARTSREFLAQTSDGHGSALRLVVTAIGLVVTVTGRLAGR